MTMHEHSLASLGPNGFHRIAYAEWIAATANG
jgi:hypothetical protein